MPDRPSAGISGIVKAPSSRRKQACLACRARKKKCDGRQPACIECSKWNMPCSYNSPSIRGQQNSTIIPPTSRPGHTLPGSQSTRRMISSFETPWQLRSPGITFFPDPKDMTRPWKPPPGYPSRSSDPLSLAPPTWEELSGKRDPSADVNISSSTNTA
ncbi:hypothetical protein F5884DRAFT_862994 [Xylogone sp. PMI_703]|nr:hypothetical protein F5884DRAFT_862994 [Xylogone sp. PMI_703]